LLTTVEFGESEKENALNINFSKIIVIIKKQGMKSLTESWSKRVLPALGRWVPDFVFLENFDLPFCFPLSVGWVWTGGGR